MIHLSQITKQYGRNILYQDANFQVRPGDKIGLVGANGQGKSTLFRIIMGTEGVDSGSISIAERITIGHFSQEVGEMHGRTALTQTMAGAGRVAQLAEDLQNLEAQLQSFETHPPSEEKMMQILDRYGEAQLEYEQRDGYGLQARAETALTGLGIGPEAHHQPVESFSGGWKMRIALAAILVLNPDVLLMDEPTNHLDLESILWLEEWLVAYPGALVMTSHDREFMNRIVRRIVEVGQKTITTYSGNYDYYLQERELRLTQQRAAHAKQQDMLAKEEEFIARFGKRASHAAQVQSRVKKLDKIERIEIPPQEKTIHFDFPEPPRSGNDVVKLGDLGKTYTDPKLGPKKVFSGISGVVRRLDKIAVLGVNGAGKSTLLKIITGQTDPTQGFVQLGASVLPGYFSQHALELLNPDRSIYEEIHNRIPQATLGFVRNLLGAFLFSGDDIHKKIAVLSGGEKSRVVLASLLARPVNFLVLDEPTNHLDLASTEVLLSAIQGFQGTVMLVSHDRHFLRAVAGRVFEVDRGELRVYEGNYEFYLDQKRRSA